MATVNVEAETVALERAAEPSARAIRDRATPYMLAAVRVADTLAVLGLLEERALATSSREAHDAIPRIRGVRNRILAAWIARARVESKGPRSPRLAGDELRVLIEEANKLAGGA